METSSQEGVGEDIGIDLQGIPQLTTATTAAVARVLAVIQAVGGINNHQLAIVRNALQVAGGGLFTSLELGDGEYGRKHRVIHGNGLQGLIAKQRLHLTPERAVPVRAGATG